MSKVVPETSPDRGPSRSTVRAGLLLCGAVLLPGTAVAGGGDVYTMTNLGAPPGAYITTAVLLPQRGSSASYAIC